MDTPATQADAAAAVIPPPRRPLAPGKPFPEDFTCRDGALADQRHAQIRTVATKLVVAGAAVARAGYSTTDAGVHFTFTADHVLDAVTEAVGQCKCPGCEGPAALMLIGDLALRVGELAAQIARLQASSGGLRDAA